MTNVATLPTLVLDREFELPWHAMNLTNVKSISIDEPPPVGNRFYPKSHSMGSMELIAHPPHFMMNSVDVPKDDPMVVSDVDLHRQASIEHLRELNALHCHFVAIAIHSGVTENVYADKNDHRRSLADKYSSHMNAFSGISLGDTFRPTFGNLLATISLTNLANAKKAAIIDRTSIRYSVLREVSRQRSLSLRLALLAPHHPRSARKLPDIRTFVTECNAGQDFASAWKTSNEPTSLAVGDNSLRVPPNIRYS